LPQALQTLLEQAEPDRHAAAPEQHASPVPPQRWHIMPLHDSPDAHAAPPCRLQHGWPASPQSLRQAVLNVPTQIPSVQVRSGQQVSLACPQAVQLMAAGALATAPEPEPAGAAGLELGPAAGVVPGLVPSARLALQTNPLWHPPPGQQPSAAPPHAEQPSALQVPAAAPQLAPAAKHTLFTQQPD
jgi:hypothetical protein